MKQRPEDILPSEDIHRDLDDEAAKVVEQQYARRLIKTAGRDVAASSEMTKRDDPEPKTPDKQRD